MSVKIADQFEAIADRMRVIEYERKSKQRDDLLNQGHSHGFSPAAGAFVMRCSQCGHHTGDYVIHHDRHGNARPLCRSCDEQQF